MKRLPNSGRQRKTTDAEDMTILNAFKQNPFLTASSFARSSSFHRRLVVKRLNENGIKNHVACRHTEMSPDVKEKRVIFCKQMLHAFPDGNGIERLIFSDEKTFLSDPVHRTRVYRPINCRHNSDYVQTARIKGNINYNFWGAISFNGPIGDIAPVGSHFNSDRYAQTLQMHLIPYLKSNDQYMFIQDNAAIHTSDRIADLFRENNIVPIVFPAYSPDLNLIEHVWPAMTRDWQRMENRNVETLIQALRYRWNDLKMKPGKWVRKNSV